MSTSKWASAVDSGEGSTDSPSQGASQERNFDLPSTTRNDSDSTDMEVLLHSSSDSTGLGQSLGRLPTKKLSMWGLAFLAFFSVSGGPFGIEGAIQHAQPLVVIILLFVFPWVWSLPCALMTAELGSAMPDSGAFVKWILRSFGAFWAHQVAVWSLAANVFNGAIYPVLVFDYISSVRPSSAAFGVPDWVGYFLKLFTLLACFGMNFFGVDIVSKFSGVFIAVIMAPFLVLIALSVPYFSFSQAFALPTQPLAQVNWSVVIATIAWMTGGFDNTGQVVSEVEQPSKNYPRALTIVIASMILGYILPVLFSVCVKTDYSAWGEGYFAVVAGEVGGNWLRIPMVLAACLSSIGVLNAYLCTASQMLSAWSEPSLLNIELLSRKSSYKTPYIALIVNIVLMGLGSLLPFSFVIEVNQLWYSLVLISEYAALLWYRFKMPDMQRPYRVPMGNALLVLFVAGPMILCGFTFFLPIVEAIQMGSSAIPITTICILGCGAGSYPLIGFIRKKFGRNKKENLVGQLEFSSLHDDIGSHTHEFDTNDTEDDFSTVPSSADDEGSV